MNFLRATICAGCGGGVFAVNFLMLCDKFLVLLYENFVFKIKIFGNVEMQVF